MEIIMTLPIEPQGKLSPKPIVVGTHIKVSGRPAILNAHAQARKHPDTEAYEAQLAAMIVARWPCGLAFPPGVPLGADYLFVRTRPQALRRKKDPDGLTWAPVKPDWDNNVKAVQDALFDLDTAKTITARAIECALGDDGRIVLGRAAKLYTEKNGHPRIVLRLYTGLPDLAAPPLWLERLVDHDPFERDEWTPLGGGMP